MAPTTKRRRNVATKLGIDLAPPPRSHWEGTFLHTSSRPNESYFMRATIGMAGEALEGEACILPDRQDQRSVTAEISGAVEGRKILFTVWLRIKAEPEPFTCRGTLNARANLIRGTWRHPCYAGKACSCEGGGGLFELRRTET